MSETRHPIQPLYKDEHGALRFKGNAIVRYLLDAGPFDLNHCAVSSRSYFGFILTTWKSNRKRGRHERKHVAAMPEVPAKAQARP